MVKCPYGEISVWLKVRVVKGPCGEMSVFNGPCLTVRVVKCPVTVQIYIDRGKQGINQFFARLRALRWHMFFNELIVLLTLVKGELVSMSSHVLKYQFSRRNNTAESGRQLKKLS